MTFIRYIFLILFVAGSVSSKCRKVLQVHADNGSDTEQSIAGCWIGDEPGAGNYRIVYRIVEESPGEYSGTEYGFQNGRYAGHWNLDSISFDASSNELHLFNETHNGVFRGVAAQNGQSISGTIASYEVNGPMTLTRTEEKALKGLYPRGSAENERVSYAYRRPGKCGDGWETSTLEEEGMDSERIVKAIQKIIAGEFTGMTSLLIVKNNKLVCEEYFYGHDRSCLNRLGSCSKSVTSLLFGMAMDAGAIGSVDEPVMNYFPGYKDLQTMENAEIRIKHLLTMTAGFDWDEMSYSYDHPKNTLTEMSVSGDYLKFIFQRPMVNVPGETFNYSCACTILLGRILKNATGMEVDQYAGQHLFGPMGITDYYWHKREDGFTHVEGGLWLTARDLAKIGSLVLNQGKWQDEQIVSAGWIAASTRQHVPQNGMQPGYGYQWWNIHYPAGGRTIYGIMALGADPEMLIIIPELNTIIVTTGPFLFVEEEKSPLRMIMEYIIPAVIR